MINTQCPSTHTKPQQALLAQVDVFGYRCFKKKRVLPWRSLHLRGHFFKNFPCGWIIFKKYPYAWTGTECLHLSLHLSSSLFGLWDVRSPKLKLSFAVSLLTCAASLGWGKKRKKPNNNNPIRGIEHVLHDAILRSRTKPEKYRFECSLQKHRVCFSVHVNASARSCFVSGLYSNNRTCSGVDEPQSRIQTKTEEGKKNKPTNSGDGAERGLECIRQPRRHRDIRIPRSDFMCVRLVDITYRLAQLLVYVLGWTTSYIFGLARVSSTCPEYYNRFTDIW